MVKVFRLLLTEVAHSLLSIIHTADWHIGHSLNGWDRDEEHRQFFSALAELLVDRQADALIVSGDVYDNLNPSGESQRLLYDAIAAFRVARPNLQIIITSGNHDPAGRLQAPSALLQAHGCRVMATVRRQGADPDWAAHLVRVTDAEGTARAVVATIPFLRAADLPGLTFGKTPEGASPVVDAVRSFHTNIALAAKENAPDLPLIAMGHLTCIGGNETESSERRIMIGGEHAVPAEAFGPEFAYVALGHLHMPQTLGGGRIRYSGSCFPMSVSEARYRHGVTLIEVTDGNIRHEHLPISRPAEFIRIPEQGQASPEEFEALLAGLELDPDLPADLRPFLYAQLSATGPASAILAEAQRLVAEYPIRLADIRIVRAAQDGQAAREQPESLADTSPERLFIEEFRKINLIDPEPRHLAAFRDAAVGVDL